jgi:hypothetical protein
MFWNTIDKDNKNKRDKIELEIDKIVFDGDVHNNNYFCILFG